MAKKIMTMQSSMPLQPQLNHRMLLVNLRKSIELWFLGRRDHMYDECEDLYSDVQSAIVAIVSHGLQFSMQSADKTRLHKFIDDLQWLAASGQSKGIMHITDAESLSFKDFLTSWVQQNLKNSSFTWCLQMLVRDKEILNAYYPEYSFLQNKKYTTALFICVSAVELNHSALLSQIDPNLFAESMVQFKRAVSHPNLSMSPPKKKTPININLNTSDASSTRPFRVRSTIRKWHSLSVIKQQEIKNRKRSHTIGNMRDVSVNVGRLHKALNKQDKLNIPNKQNAESLQSASSSEYSSRSTTESTGSSTIGIEIIKCDHIKIWEDHTLSRNSADSSHANKLSPTVGTSTLDMNCDVQSQSCSSPSPINSFLSNIFSVSSFRPNSGSSYNDSSNSMCFSSSAQNDSVLNSFLPRCGEKLPPRKTSNIFEDTSAPLNTKLGTSGPSFGDQTLEAFLQATQYSRNSNELERENAHFRICEAIISAIERIKCQKLEDNAEKVTKIENDVEDIPGTSSQVYQSLDRIQDADGRLSPKEAARNNFEEAADIREHMPYAELGQSSLDDLHSAENIGLSLISKFNDKHLPKVSDLKWLVSEEDTCQQLLPMPQKSNNPDENIAPMVTRGTRYWAPPRQQIIFTNHPAPRRKFLIQKQNYLCAGCGMRVSTSHIKSFRYCTYLGKYHCTGCHRNQISAIPAKVLQLWDFNFYPVSVFAYRLLEQMWTYPLFYVPDLNPALYTESRALRTARLKRVQTQYIKEFITTCRFAEDEKIYFSLLPDYISSDPDTWSMSDFMDAKTKTIHKSLQDLIRKCEDHIFGCVLCSARGFICEFCRKDTVIYPWQSKVLRCDSCGTCFHFNCWKTQYACPRCQRLKSRHMET